MLPHTFALASRLNKPLVVFDLEHTGGTKEARCVTEFASCVVLPDGTLKGYSSLVKPPSGTTFNPHVSRITGINARTVAKAPPWSAVAKDAVLPYQDAVWVGFNSRATDIPMVVMECARRYLPFSTPAHQLDLMRLSAFKGNLFERALRLLPDMDFTGAHRAAQDALVTLWLLEATLPAMSSAQLEQAMQPESPVMRSIAPEPLRGTRPLELTWATTQPEPVGFFAKILDCVF